MSRNLQAQADGRDVHFAAMHAMAELDDQRLADLIATADRPTLEWAYYCMCQTFFTAVRNLCAGDLDATTSSILQFVRAMEALESARQAVDG